MTTADISQANGTQYTWDNQTLVWSAQDAGLRTWDVSYDVIAYTLTIGESFGVAELCANTPSLSVFEAFALVESRAATVGLNKGESFSFVESLVQSYGMNVVETLGVADGVGNTVGLNKSESFVMAEVLSNGCGLNAIESFSIAESCLNSVGFIREFIETLSFADSLAHTYGLNRAEAFAVVDSWRRQADMVISDMMLASGDMTLNDFADFMKYGNVPGYEKWRDFIPGDYEYREAMIRVVMESKNADRGLLTNLQATVDVPDLIDRGSAMITNASSGIAITYNRHFHIVPEITLSARGGTGGNPIAPEFYGTPTTSGFTVRLRDTVTGAFVTGSFTWAAHGY